MAQTEDCDADPGSVMKKELHAELLLGRRVFALNGRAIGRIEEISVVEQQGRVFITEYLVGAYALLERLSALSIGRAMLRSLGARVTRDGYRVGWDQMDLSNPDRPRLSCPVDQLMSLKK